MEHATEATITATARMGGVKIHGPNSPDVLSGKYPLGYKEHCVDFGEDAVQSVEVNYETAVVLWGVETADKLFAGVKED